MITPDESPANCINGEMSIELYGEEFIPSGVSVVEIEGCPRWEMLAFVEQQGYDEIVEWVISTYDSHIADVASEEGPELYEAEKSDYMDREYHRRKVDPNYKRY
jgi:hypothetical protein